jgi:hypothetical protein
MPAVSKKQQKFMGIVHGLQKGTVKPSEVSKKAQNVAKDMKPKAATDFASTKHKGLPTKVKKENVDGAIDTLYMVKKPFDGCNASSLVAPLDPLQGAQDQVDQVHGVFPDQDQAMAIAETLYEEYCAKMEALEEKKGAVTGKISSAIDSLEKKRKEHVDMAKEDPKNASQHKDKIAMLATKIDDLMSKLEKVERSKKAKEIDAKKDKKKVVKENEDKSSTSTSGLAKMFRQLAQSLPTTPGMSSKEIAGIEKLINTILSKASAGEIALAIGKAQLALDNSTKNLGGKPAMPAVPKKSGNFSLNNDR